MIIFLYGEDTFRSQEKTKEFRNKFSQKNESGLQIIDFEENPNIELGKIKEAIGSKGLFSQKQLIIFKNILSSKVSSPMLEFLKSSKNILEDKDTVLLFWEKAKPKKNNKLYEFLSKSAKKQRFELLEGAKLSRWIENKIKEINPKVGISKKALEKLISFVGADLLILTNEIEKLTAFRNEGEIEEEDIENLVKAKINSNIFETIEALLSGNKKKAILLYHKQLENGQDSFYILSMYAYQIRNLLKIEDIYSNETKNPYEIAKITKLHPFVVQKGMKQIRFLSGDKLKNIFSQLQKIDMEAKTGKADIKLALDKFIAEV